MKEVAGLAGTVPGRQALQDPGMGKDEGGDESLGRNWTPTRAPRASYHFFSFPKSVTQCATRSLLGRQLKRCFERQALKTVQTFAGAFTVSKRVYFVCLNCQQTQTMSHYAKRGVATKDLNDQLLNQPK